MTFEELMNKSPVVAGALIAALVGASSLVITSFVTLFVNWRTLRSDRKQKERERIFAVRRELYLGAADWAQSSIASLCALGTGNVSLQDALKETNKNSEIVSKLEVVGGAKTIEVAFAIAAMYQQKYSELVPLRSGVDWRRGELNRLREAGEKLRQDDNRWSDVKLRHDGVLLQQRVDVRKLGQQAYDAASDLANLSADLTLAMRADLSIPIKPDEYRKIIRDHLTVARTHIERTNEFFMSEAILAFPYAKS